MSTDLEELLSRAPEVLATDDVGSAVELARDVLLAAQCGSEADARRAAKFVGRELPTPHHVVSDALFELLVLFPREVIPQVSDIVGSESQTIERVLVSYSELLKEDRSLLTAIVASLSDLPLEEEQKDDLRDTLEYALGTVEENDLPAIVHAILRNDPSAETLIVMRDKARCLSDGVASLVNRVIVEACRLNARTIELLLEICGQCQGGVTAIDVAVWSTGLCRSKVRSGAAVSVRRAATLNAITTDCLSYLFEVQPSVWNLHPDGLRKLSSLVLQLSGEPGSAVKSGVVKTLLLGVLNNCAAVRRSVLSDVVASLCSENEAIALHAALTIKSIAVARPAWLDGWIHIVVEPLQRPYALNRSAAGALAETAAVLVRGRPQLTSSMLVSIRKQLLSGTTEEKLFGVKVARNLIPKLPSSAADETFQLLIRAAPSADVDSRVGAPTVQAVAHVVASGATLNTQSARLITGPLDGIVDVLPNGVARVSMRRLQEATERGVSRKMVVAVATLMVSAASGPALDCIVALDTDAESTLDGREARSAQHPKIVEELRLASDVIVSVVNLCATLGSTARRVLGRLQEAQNLRSAAAKLESHPPTGFGGDEAVSGPSCAKALEAMEVSDGDVDLLSTLLRQVAALSEGQEALDQVARLPKLKALLRRALDDQNESRRESARASGRGESQASELLAARAKRCCEGIAHGLDIIVLNGNDARALAEEVVAGISDAGVACRAVDMAMRNDASDAVAAQLWLRTVRRVYEAATGELVPDVPLALSRPSFASSLAGSVSRKRLVLTASEPDRCLRYRLISMFACLSVDDGVDEASAWTRELRLGEKSSCRGVVTPGGSVTVLPVLAQLACGAARAPAASAMQATQRIALLRGVLELGGEAAVTSAAVGLHRSMSSIFGLEGGARCLAAIRALRDELDTLTSRYRAMKERRYRKRLPRMVLASSTLTDFIGEMQETYSWKGTVESPLKSTDDTDNYVGRKIELKNKPRKRKEMDGNTRIQPPGTAAKTSVLEDSKVTACSDSSSGQILVRFR